MSCTCIYTSTPFAQQHRHALCSFFCPPPLASPLFSYPAQDVGHQVRQQQPRSHPKRPSYLVLFSFLCCPQLLIDHLHRPPSGDSCPRPPGVTARHRCYRRTLLPP
uniref:Uncharacterized protein n=1 Tax=Opuntia streptacantha TaxID=393608 RepID=A0A7C8YNP4_OPUST